MEKFDDIDMFPTLYAKIPVLVMIIIVNRVSTNFISCVDVNYRKSHEFSCQFFHVIYLRHLKSCFFCIL